MNGCYQQVPAHVVVAIDNVFEFLGWLYQTRFDARARDHISERIARLWLQDQRGPMRKLLLYIADLTQTVAKSPPHRQEGLRHTGIDVFRDIFRNGTVFGDAEIVDLLHRMIEHSRPGATGVPATPFASQAVPRPSLARQQARGLPPIPPVPQLPSAAAASGGTTTAPISGAAGAHQPWAQPGAAPPNIAGAQPPRADQSVYAFKNELDQREFSLGIQLMLDNHIRESMKKILNNF